ncbi:hypothetical protein PMIN01_04937 [Paraphaeosphaeria minitans]|uniref:Uncharacterized protein n=1 Tax=Paraphaeosphaeria minitans TaxID=565426 RepID=A0A9P6GL92_9PLEO|nr:hypothetical protein PMIN01_04937 [Paraphaeosphaeria minitans]
MESRDAFFAQLPLGPLFSASCLRDADLSKLSLHLSTRALYNAKAPGGGMRHRVGTACRPQMTASQRRTASTLHFTLPS